MKRHRITPIEIFLLALALILTSVSFRQTWLGMDQLFGPAAMWLALVLSSLLLLLDYLLRNARLEGTSVGGLMAMYGFVAILCFVANFNALYTRFMRTDIYRQELNSLNSNFNGLQTDVLAKFNYKYPRELAQEVDIKKRQLMEQIQDPGNPGIGDRAKSIIKDIEKALGEKVDILSPVGHDYADLAYRMGKQIDSMVMNLSPQESELKDEIDGEVLKYNRSLQEVSLQSNKEIDEEAPTLIQEGTNDYNKLGGKAQTILAQQKFKFKPLDSQVSEVGKIGFAFRHAWENFGVYPIVVLLGCLILDFLIPVLIALIIRSEEAVGDPLTFLSPRRQGRTLFPKA